MKNLVIAGTSGVGKSFLEDELEKRNLYFQIPKYTNREARSGDNPLKLKCLGFDEFEENRTNFFFTLKYNNFDYGWKKEDLKKRFVVLDMTLESLGFFLKKNPSFLPVLLEVSENNLEMLKTRMKNRGESEEKITKRLELSRKELKNMENYRKIVKKYDGLIFEIKDDKTIFEEIIPELAKRR